MKIQDNVRLTGKAAAVWLGIVDGGTGIVSLN